MIIVEMGVKKIEQTAQNSWISLSFKKKDSVQR